MKRKLRLISLFCIVAMLFCACSSTIENEYYKIYNRFGNTYIKFNSTITSLYRPNINPYRDEHVYAYGTNGLPNITFTSVSEMKQRIATGDIDTLELARLYANLTETTGKNNNFKIFDVNNPYDLALPEGVKYKKVEWNGSWCEFSDFNMGLYRAVLKVNQPKESFNEDYEKEYENAPNWEGENLISDTVIEDRNARVVHYKNIYGEFKELYYTVTTPRGETHVRECYTLKLVSYYNHYDKRVSETVPDDVYLFGFEDDNHFWVHFPGVSERPSIEWISSFGVVPYTVEAAD